MKLASALKLRSNLKKQLSDLRSIISDGLVVQEGMTKPNPNENYTKYVAKLDELEQLIININDTNIHTTVCFKDQNVSISELILLKDEVILVIDILNSILQRSEEQRLDDVACIRMVSVVDRDLYQTKLDAAKDEKLAIEMVLEEANCQVDLREH